MEKPTIRILDDGEIEGGVPSELDYHPKKKRPSRWRRPRRVLKGFLLAIPVVLVTIFVTLLATEKIDPNVFEWYRRLCLSTLGPNRLTYATGEAPTTIGFVQMDVESGRYCYTLSRLPQGTTSLSWSPDGNQLLYILYALEEPSPSLRLINADGSNNRLLVSLALDGKWSPDGKSIQYWRTDKRTSSGQFVRYEINADGTNAHEITEENAFAESSTNNRPNLPSPNGKYIAYLQREGQTTNVYVANHDGTNNHLVATDVHANSVQWKPQPSS
jgi:hypothetical protein